jgi:hypothetical protein
MLLSGGWKEPAAEAPLLPFVSTQTLTFLGFRQFWAADLSRSGLVGY